MNVCLTILNNHQSIRSWSRFANGLLFGFDVMRLFAWYFFCTFWTCMVFELVSFVMSSYDSVCCVLHGKKIIFCKFFLFFMFLKREKRVLKCELWFRNVKSRFRNANCEFLYSNVVFLKLKMRFVFKFSCF